MGSKYMFSSVRHRSEERERFIVLNGPVTCYRLWTEREAKKSGWGWKL